MQREKIEIKKGVQGYYPFCVSSLEGIRKAVIPSQQKKGHKRDTSYYPLFCKEVSGEKAKGYKKVFLFLPRKKWKV